jgi:hypothetical protein
MSSIFLFFWSIGLPCYFTNYYSIPDYCSLRLSEFEYQVRIYDSNDYLVSSKNPNLSSWITWLENPNSNELFVDSCHILLEITDCINPTLVNNLETDRQLPTLVCFYSIYQNPELHDKRIELLRKLSFQTPFRLLLVLQDYPHQLYLENSASDE